MQNTPEKNLRSNNPDAETFSDVNKWLRGTDDRGWVEEGLWQYYDEILGFSYTIGEHMLMLRRDAFDPLVPDIQDFFDKIKDFVTDKMPKISSPLDLIKGVMDSLWYWIAITMETLITEIKEKITDLVTYISNIVTWIMWNFVDDVTTFAANLFKPIKDAWDTVTGTLETWFSEIYDAITGFLKDPWTWITDALSDLWDWLKSIKDAIWDSLVWVADVIGSYIGIKLNEFAPVVVEYLRDALLWLWDNIKTGFLFVVEDLLPAAWNAASGALGWLKDEFTNLIGLAYDELMAKATELVPITPERSAGVAAAMFGSAVGFGALAHGMALAVEALPNLKYMGVHYLSAFVSRMGSFGTISSATMGVIAGLAIREPFGYYIKSLIRPTQPREMDLQIMAVKPDIDIETFRQGMKYQGYSDFWINAFERTMFHEPSYFEMSMLAEDEVATDKWLFTKARRAGYTEEDAEVFTSSMIKKVIRDQRKEYYKQAFNAFKEGYITQDKLEEYMDHLELRPEAKALVVTAARLAYNTELTKDYIKTWTTSLRDDLITEAECKTALASLGLTDDRIYAILELEWVKKQPKILKAERKEIETEWRDVQRRYTSLYIESFRRGLIDEDVLATNLTAIGMEARAARATARYEAIKKVPKVKPLEIVVPAIPPPPSPPTYED